MRTCGVPVAIGEQLGNRHDFWAYIRAEVADVLQPNVWKVGGVGEWMKIAHAAQLANLVIAPHDSLELSCHLVDAIRNGFLVENIFGGNLSDLGVVERCAARDPIRGALLAVTLGVRHLAVEGKGVAHEQVPDIVSDDEPHLVLNNTRAHRERVGVRVEDRKRVPPSLDQFVESVRAGVGCKSLEGILVHGNPSRLCTDGTRQVVVACPGAPSD